mmetsp:Transcript_89675/g.164632  ORF Transcript_89675/g.164632 Transcript_89675/m.164632 type:complete len:227 (-) Transcript_89675:127-807(-)
MMRLFGRAKEEPAKPPTKSPDEVVAEMEKKIADTDGKISQMDVQIKGYIAKGASNAAAKSQALTLMKRKKVLEGQRDTMQNQLLTLQDLQFKKEEAEMNKTIFNAMVSAKDEIKAANSGMDVASVEKMTDELAELKDDMEFVSEALANAGGMGADAVDNDELEAEFAKLQEESAMEQLAGVSITGEPASSAAAPKSKEDTEYAALLASMGPGAAPEAAAAASAPPA